MPGLLPKPLTLRITLSKTLCWARRSGRRESPKNGARPLPGAAIALRKRTASSHRRPALAERGKTRKCLDLPCWDPDCAIAGTGKGSPWRRQGGIEAVWSRPGRRTRSRGRLLTRGTNRSQQPRRRPTKGPARPRDALKRRRRRPPPTSPSCPCPCPWGRRPCVAANFAPPPRAAAASWCWPCRAAALPRRARNAAP